MEKTDITNIKKQVLKEALEVFDLKNKKLLEDAIPQFCNNIEISGYGDKAKEGFCKIRLAFFNQFYPHSSVIAAVILDRINILWLRDVLLGYFPLEEFPIKNEFEKEELV